MTKGIPFEIKLSNRYSDEEIVDEIVAIMRFEGMDLTKEEVEMLHLTQKLSSSERESLIQGIIEEYKEA